MIWVRKPHLDKQQIVVTSEKQSCKISNVNFYGRQKNYYYTGKTQFVVVYLAILTLPLLNKTLQFAVDIIVHIP